MLTHCGNFNNQQPDARVNKKESMINQQLTHMQDAHTGVALEMAHVLLTKKVNRQR